MVDAWRGLIADAKRNAHASPEILARSHAWLAWSLDYLDQTDAALIEAMEAERIVNEAGLDQRRFHVDILSTLSMVRTDLGKVDAGAVNAAAALALATRDGPESAEASFAHNALGAVAYARGRYADAAAEYGAATEGAVACLPPGDALIVNQMASHAGTLYMVGRVEDALAENQRAARWALAHLTPDNPVITLTLGNLGVMLRSAGRYSEAEAALRRVVDLEGRYQKDRWYYRAISLSNFASVIEAQGRHQEAEVLWLKSSEFHRKATIKRDPVTPAYPLRFAADAAQARGEYALALARRAEGLRLVDKDVPADHPEVARARIEYALTLTLLHRDAEALTIAEPAIAVVRAKLGASDTKRLTAEVDYARIVAAVRGAEAGYVVAAPVALLLETKLLDAATSHGDLLRYGRAFSTSFAAVADLALQSHRDEAAFHALQLANLSDIVVVSSDVAARAAAGNPATAQLIRGLQDRVRDRQLLDRTRTFAASANDAAELAQLETAIRANDAAIAEASRTLEARLPAFRALGRPVPVALAAVQAALQPSQILLAPLAVEDGTLAISVSRTGLQWRKAPLPRFAVDALVARIDRAIAAARDGSNATFDTEAATALFTALVPDAKALTVKRDVLYYASGSLATLSPGLLLARPLGLHKALANADWLIRTHSVTVVPTLLPHRRSAAVAMGGGLLGIGAPVLSGVTTSLPTLPGATTELKLIAASISGPSTLLLGINATESEFRRHAAAPHSTIVFATHAVAAGVIEGQSEPALLLTPGTNAANDDGRLTASEIAGLRLDSDWVVLSACDSAGAGEAGGPAYGGLANAFLQAGAKALLVSHWPVRDDAAARLTVATLAAAARGVPRPVALQRAMIAVMHDSHLPGAAHPATWAPFVLIDR